MNLGAMGASRASQLQPTTGPTETSKRMTLMLDQVSANSAGGPILETVSITDEILDTVTRAESESHLRETGVTTTQETETTIKRTFGNPYLDRSLQLRFIPVFNRFEVVTSLLRLIPGLVGHFAEPAPTPARRTAITDMHEAAARASHTDVSVRPVASWLHATEAVGDDDAARPHGAAAADCPVAGQAEPRGWACLAADGDARERGACAARGGGQDLVAAWGLRGSAANGLVESLGRIAPDRLGAIFEPRVRTVHVFAGTHVEAVPGTCVLPGIPLELAVIVPGATQYVRQTS